MRAVTWLEMTEFERTVRADAGQEDLHATPVGHLLTAPCPVGASIHDEDDFNADDLYLDLGVGD